MIFILINTPLEGSDVIRAERMNSKRSKSLPADQAMPKGEKMLRGGGRLMRMQHIMGVSSWAIYCNPDTTDGSYPNLPSAHAAAEDLALEFPGSVVQVFRHVDKPKKP